MGRPSQISAPVGSQAANRLTTSDALSYLREVKTRFSREKRIYDTFLEIMKDFKAQKCVLILYLLFSHVSHRPFDVCDLEEARALFVPQVRAKYGAESSANSATTAIADSSAALFANKKTFLCII